MFSFATGQIADAEVHVGARYEADFDYFLWAGIPSVRADGLGQFRVSGLPGTKVSVFARARGYQQPCAVILEVPGQGTARIEMMREPGAAAVVPSRPQTGLDPLLQGQVYENTAEGRRPVEGAELWVEQPDNVVVASTRSDAGGNFLLCNLPERYSVVVAKPGYALRWLRAADLGSGAAGIELVRANADPRDVTGTGNYAGDRVTTSFQRAPDAACPWTIEIGNGRVQVDWQVTIDGTSIELDQDLSNRPTDNTLYRGTLRGTVFKARYANEDAARLACGFRESILIGEFYDDFSTFIATEWLTWGPRGKEIWATQRWVVRQRRR